MIFNITGSNDTIVVVNQTNIGGGAGSQSNVLLLSGGVLTPVPPAPPVRGYQSSYAARF